jgi:hypothetical protein
VLDLARAPLPLAPPEGMPPKQYLLAFRDSMVDRYQERNDDMSILVSAWHGTYNYSRSSQNWNMDAQGHPLLRTSDRSSGAMPVTINIYKGFVDAYRKLMIEMPDARVPRPHGLFTPDLQGQKQAESWSERMRRAAYGIWAASQMDIQQIDIAWYLTVCGSVGLVLWPDFERGHPLIRTIAPWDIYGVGKMNDPLALSRCIVSVEEDQLVVASDYPREAAQGDYRRNPLTDASGMNPALTTARGERTTRRSVYIDEKWFVWMLGDEIIDAEKHDLDFCPALIAPLIRLPGYVNRGHSVAEQTLPMQNQIDFSASIWAAGAKDAIFKTTVVKDPINVPENFQRGKGQLITTTAEGSVTEFGGDPQALKIVTDYFNFLKGAMSINTGVSEAALRGQLQGGGPTTGRGIDRSMTPFLASAEEMHKTSAIYHSRALLYAFRWAAKHGFWMEGPDDEVTFSGLMKDAAIEERFSRKELLQVRDITVVYPPMAGLSLHERVNIALQLFNTKPALLSWQKIIELTGLVDNVEELRAQIESDNAWRVQIMKDEVAAQQPQQSQQPQGGGGDPEALAASLQGGATNRDTLARAGAGGARPAIPAAGAPAGPSPDGGDAGDAGALSDQQVLDPQRLAAIFQRPPDAAPKQQSGLMQRGAATKDGGDIKNEVAALGLVGDAYLKGKTLLVDWRDKTRVKEVTAHHPEITVQVLPKGVVPQGATLIASGKGGPKDAGNN